MAGKRVVGVTVMPEYVQAEGIDGVLDNLVAAGVNALSTSPYVMELADEATGQREPPDDAGAGKVRLLDRPLWGKRELFVRTSPSFKPNRKLYRNLRYQPAEPDELTETKGSIIAEFIKAARKRKLKVYFQIQAAIPPGYRVQFGGPVDEDRPALPDGTLPSRRVAKNGSLASPHILRYQNALIRDLIEQYPDIHGIRFDWPEYPPYLLDDCFYDFSEHARKEAHKLGFDFERMRQDMWSLYQTLNGGLTDAMLEPWAEKDGGRFGLMRLLADYPGIGDTLAFKAILSDRLLGGFRQAMNDAGGEHMEMLPNAFPPPWTLASGLDFARAGRHSNAISVKLYSMHWAMMLRFYADQILSCHRKLSSELLARALVNILDIADDAGLPRCEDYHYPEPSEAHPAGLEAMKRKIAQAQREAGETPIIALAHGYGPLADFRKRYRAAFQASNHGVWVNRYCYLGNPKLKAMAGVHAE